MNAPPRQPELQAAPPPAHLQRLPVFLDLQGRNVLLSGRGVAARSKAELLQACGARVSLRIEGPGALLEWWQGLRDDPCVLRLADADPLPPDLSCWIAEADSLEHAVQLRAAATQARVWLNVIDHPQYCDFQFGSIVNRSPLVIGISSSGSAPVLAQAVRERIEAMLPPRLGRWAQCLQALRATIRQRLPQAGLRAAWYRHWLSRCWLEAPRLADLHDSLSAAQRVACAGSGKVWLVGAGPGSADHLTLKALRCLQSADVILYDDLVSSEVLDLARREALRISVGKRGASPSCAQTAIGEQMLAHARAGKQVVRLKSGDPLIFGRAAEEIDLLAKAGIAVEAVSGISAAVALGARLGVSLTQRGVAQGLRLVTAHGRHGGLPPGLSIPGLADPHCTTVFYMVGETGAELCRQLIAAGLAADLPAVVAEALGHANEERLWCGRLDQVAGRLAARDRRKPVLLGIGKAFAAALAEDAAAHNLAFHQRLTRVTTPDYPARVASLSGRDCPSSAVDAAAELASTRLRPRRLA